MSDALKGKSSWLKNNHLPHYCKKHLSEVLKDTKLMNNGKEHKFVKVYEVDKYLSSGWKFGHIHIDRTKEKCVCWITNGKETKRVKKEELQSYYSKGYKTGRT